MAVLALKQEYDKIRIPLKKEAKEKVSLGGESEKVISELKNDTKKGIDDLDIACKKQIEINKEAYIKIPINI